MSKDLQSTPPSLVEERLDKWLKIARLYKTRSLATKACEDRRVKVNGSIAKPSKELHVGDRITLRTTGGKYIELEVLGLCLKSIAARDARLLYRLIEKEMSEGEKELLQLFEQAARSARPRYKGRPTKKERRRLEKFRDNMAEGKSPFGQ
jgi:ribosome-associated heat shock protein Hsp15